MRFRYPLFLALAALLLAPLASAQASLSGIVINEILADPNSGSSGFDTDGDGTSETEDEFVELYNTTGAPVDLSGWELYQVSGGSAVLAHTFAGGTTIGANGYFVVVSAWDPGTPPAGIEFASEGSLGLTNGGDEVFLFDPGSNTYIGAYYNGGQTAVTIGTATLAGEDDFGDDTDTESLQRQPDGSTTIASATPTPNATNGQPVEVFAGYLLGANEVPAVTTDAAGAVTATLDGSDLTLEGRFAGLAGDYTASHLHLAPAGGIGAPFATLSPTLGADNRSGTFAETVTLDAAQVNALRAGEVYLNVHSAANPGGELRAQLVTAPDAAEVTLQQARYIGPGYAVVVGGTVTRAMGDFTYVQDATGGLALRQTFGTFRDEVDAGTITGGTTLQFEGELSEFAGLLQVNNDDLAFYSVTGSTAIPDAVEVSFADLLADGEAYEGELVAVSGVTFTDTGVFEAGTTYSVSDGTGTFDVRIDGDEETATVGVDIPSGPAVVTGVVGQRDFDSPAVTGYRLLPILATDVQLATANEDALGRLGARLAVENPARGAVSVRFDVGTPGAATLTVFDAVGRRVAVLAEGEFAAGAQAATLDTGALASGVYVVRLSLDGGALTRVVTVVR